MTVTSPVTTASLDEARKQYPQYAWMFDIPKVGDLIKQAITEGWPDGRLTGEIQGTDWWKQTVPALRQYQQDIANDPAKVDQQLRQVLPDIYDTWASLGQPTNMGDPFFTDIARQSIQQGWSAGQLKDALVSRTRYNYDQPTPVGSIGTTMDAIKAQAGNYMLTLDDHTAFNYARQVAAGEHVAADFDEVFKQQAKGQFPTLAQFIDQGTTPKDYFAPYQSQIAKLLEKNPADVDFMKDPKWMKVIDTVDDKGNRRPMTLSETSTYVRGLDDWKSTRQGQEAAATAAEGILKTFGKVA
jgi:hypothetical protein